MTKRVDTWMPLLVDKYLGDTQDLTTEQHGAYLLLLMAMWKRDGELPNSDDRLAMITRLSTARWKACKPTLMEFFTVSDDGLKLTQKRLSVELQRAKSHSDAKAEAGAKGAAKRWQRDSTAMAQPSQSQWQTGAPIPTPTPTPRKRGVAPLCPEGVSESVWADWLALRRAKKAPVTQTVIDSAMAEAQKAGMSLEAFLRVWCARGSQGLQADWLKPNERGFQQPARAGPDPAEVTRAMLDAQKQTPEERAAAEEARRRVMATVRRIA